jgi:DNA-binding MarR family transcriptional regulator
MRTIAKAGLPTTPADAHRLHDLVVALMRRRSLRDPIASTCAELELTPPQVHGLLALGLDGPLTMGDLARRTGVTEKTITGLVDRLERDRLVQRVRDAADRRVVRVRLTTTGAGLSRRIDADMLDKLDGLLGLLPPGDRRDLLRIFETLLDRIEALHPTTASRPEDAP